MGETKQDTKLIQKKKNINASPQGGEKQAEPQGGYQYAKMSGELLTWRSVLKQRWHSGNPTSHKRLYTMLKYKRHLPSTSRQQKARLRKWISGQFSLKGWGHDRVVAVGGAGL